ncbi:MAG: NAD(P)H-binding protein [Gammaproteobacteria bacterium]|nr:NAD(P)H-binding protein [Gammaproteobacteria bacterium]MBU1556611.1 NAD(P)H-binding protein [Gammaproteobacteria bacterium]MBU2069732.1 NAD(P)H-binding protein [Gammaproteobacteria bacterium]MBU2184597.1 NAD(P)H-binding protein [Gammaproteobacteria bacterium]MBU2205279.1 NAD(P)H-binding protein [Gammaproteobacteria bacterium]
MELVILGASGFIGSAITAEALSRGHQVTAVVSRPERIVAQAGLTVVGLDINDSAALTRVLNGKAVVISAFSGHAQQDVKGYYLTAFNSVLSAATAGKVGRLLVVGGAASLLLPDGSRLLDSPGFPAAYRPTAEGAAAVLQQLREQSALSWSFLSPAAEIFPGDKTGQYRLGLDHLLTDAAGKSRISTGDYAVAMLEEAEQPQHVNQRFSIAY